MQKRMLHAQIFESSQFSKLTITTRLFYIGLIAIADDKGRFKAMNEYLKAKIFLYDKIGPTKIKTMLTNTKKQNLIILYEVDNELYGYHPNWNKYRIIRKDRQKPSSIPAPRLPERQPNDNQMETQDKINKDNTKEDKINKAPDNHISQIIKGMGDKDPKLANHIQNANK